MRKVIGIGETLLDVIFRDNQPIAAVPGGSTLNAIVSLGRAGVAATLVSEVGNDRVGDHILTFLADNGVNTACINRMANGKTPASLAFLDNDNNADYVFYKDSHGDHQDFPLPDIQADDIVLFGSFFAVDPALRAQVAALLALARERGAIVYYDVNFRPSHKSDVMKITPNLLDNLDYADIVRGSRDDFETLYRKTDALKIYQSEIAFYCKNFIYTQGAAPIVVQGAAGVRTEYAIAPTETVSTIGAGDNFNAGLIFGLIKEGVGRDELVAGLSQERWNAIVATAQAFSAECCKSIYNYVSVEFGRQMQSQR